MTETNNQKSASGYLRIWQIIGDRKRGIDPLIPVSRSGWWQGVKDGRYPSAIKLSERVTVWRRADILAFLENVDGGVE